MMVTEDADGNYVDPPGTLRPRGRQRYGCVAEWVLDAASTGAIALFALLDRYCGQHETAWPGIETLASRLRVSRATIKRWMVELRGLGALERAARFRPDGSQTSNNYELVWTEPLVGNQRPATPVRDRIAGGSSATPLDRESRNESQKEALHVPSNACQPDTLPLETSRRARVNRAADTSKPVVIADTDTDTDTDTGQCLDYEPPDPAPERRRTADATAACGALQAEIERLANGRTVPRHTLADVVAVGDAMADGATVPLLIGLLRFCRRHYDNERYRNREERIAGRSILALCRGWRTLWAVADSEGYELEPTVHRPAPEPEPTGPPPGWTPEDGVRQRRMIAEMQVRLGGFPAADDDAQRNVAPQTTIPRLEDYPPPTPEQIAKAESNRAKLAHQRRQIEGASGD